MLLFFFTIMVLEPWWSHFEGPESWHGSKATTCFGSIPCWGLVQFLSAPLLIHLPACGLEKKINGRWHKELGILLPYGRLQPGPAPAIMAIWTVGKQTDLLPSFSLSLRLSVWFWYSSKLIHLLKNTFCQSGDEKKLTPKKNRFQWV